MKNFFSAITATILLFSMCTIAFASGETEQESKSPYGVRYTYIINATATSLGINSNGRATITNAVSCNSDVDKVTVSSYLQKYSNGTWTTVKHWTDTENDNRYAGSHSYYVSSGNSYRVITYFYAYDGSASESITRNDYQDY